MAAGRSEDDNGGGWWGGWIEAAKQKSAVALEQMKKDLGEFGSTIQRDTSTVVASSAGVIRDSMQTEANDSSASSRVKQGFSDLLSGLSESLAPKTSRTEEESHSESSKSSNHIFDRAKARLHAMQIDASTYCTQPEGRHHEEWLATFDTDQYKGDISDLLVANTDVRAIYTKLEANASYSCLHDSNFDRKSCQTFFVNYQNCQKFWLKVTKDRMRRGIKPTLPPLEERNRILQETG